MAGPLNGISGKQQFPAATALQQNQGNQDVRQREDAPKQGNTSRARGQETAESQAIETRNNGKSGFVLELGADYTDPNAQRGSLVDITV